MEAIQKAEKDSVKRRQGGVLAHGVGVYIEIPNRGSEVHRRCSLTSNRANTKKRFLKLLSYMKEVFVSVSIPVIIGTFVYFTLDAIMHALHR
jgi:hypothetical protein